jgi:hypothetical protein
MVELRHGCEMGDGLSSYNYLQHDGRRYAHQQLDDPRHGVSLDIRFLKLFPHPEDDSKIGNWISRLSFQPYDFMAERRRHVSALFYVQTLDPENMAAFNAPVRQEDAVVFTGQSVDVGEFAFVFFTRQDQEAIKQLPLDSRFLCFPRDPKTHWQIQREFEFDFIWAYFMC